MTYLDNAATTPCSSDVIAAMQPYFADKFGNPSSIYTAGSEARRAVSEAREQMASLLGAHNPSCVVITSGATESNNLAVKGVAFYASQVLKVKPHIIVSSIEHHCVLDTAKYLEKNFGFEVSYIPVNKEGLVDPKEVAKLIKENTVLVSVMFGNNEMGALEPIAQIGKVIIGARESRKNDFPLYFHTDAVQAFQYSDFSVEELGVDLLSLTAHKFYGPKGVGLLYIRKGTKLLPQQQGGAQEKNLRAGTENVPYIVGMAKAMEESRKNIAKNTKYVAQLKDYLVGKVIGGIEKVELIGPTNELISLLSCFTA
jgi:cysteine desulfurase